MTFDIFVVNFLSLVLTLFLPQSAQRLYTKFTEYIFYPPDFIFSCNEISACNNASGLGGHPAT